VIHPPLLARQQKEAPLETAPGDQVRDSFYDATWVRHIGVIGTSPPNVSCELRIFENLVPIFQFRFFDFSRIKRFWCAVVPLRS
jgi:hypothetical protein